MTERNQRRSDAVNLEVAVKDGLYILTKFEHKIREFGLTVEELDQYMSMLSIARDRVIKARDN